MSRVTVTNDLFRNKKAVVPVRSGLLSTKLTKERHKFRVFALCSRYKVANLKGNFILLVGEMILKRVFCLVMGRVYMYTEKNNCFLFFF